MYLYQLRKLLAEALIVTISGAMYDVRESDNFPRIFATEFICLICQPTRSMKVGDLKKKHYDNLSRVLDLNVRLSVNPH